MCRSLFDNQISPSFEANLEYMYKKFGFFFPDAEHLKDPQGLLKYLVRATERQLLPLFRQHVQSTMESIIGVHFECAASCVQWLVNVRRSTLYFFHMTNSFFGTHSSIHWPLGGASLLFVVLHCAHNVLYCTYNVHTLVGGVVLHAFFCALCTCKLSITTTMD